MDAFSTLSDFVSEPYFAVFTQLLVIR